VLGWLVFGEQMSTAKIVGGVLITAGAVVIAFA
jgi:uncharacterized membrane protein